MKLELMNGGRIRPALALKRAQTWHNVSSKTILESSRGYFCVHFLFQGTKLFRCELTEILTTT